jgi:gliding motility-associated-like protein
VLFSTLAKAQVNLVPNPSFEDYNTCPGDSGDRIYYANGWFSPTANTPDYFNSCSNPGDLNDVPQNFLGFQNARTGNGYAGFLSYSFSYPDTFSQREYLSIGLTQTLRTGKKYCCSFYVSFADSVAFRIDLLGAWLSDTIIIDNASSFYIPQIPQIESPAGLIITEQQNWFLISGEFIANGNEDYITIGCFRPNSMLTYDSLPSLKRGAYYYVDDVSVIECPDPPPVISSIATFNAFSPNGDGTNDLFITQNEHLKTYRLTVFNRWGNTVFETTDAAAGWNGTYHGRDVPEGTYYYIVEAEGEDGKQYLLKGFVMLIH